jgi:uncharacterized membrane protein
MAIMIVVAGFSVEYAELFFKRDCEGYSLFLFADEDKIDTLVGKGELVKLRAINAGSFGDKYQVSLFGPEWAVIKPTSFSLRSEQAKTLFLYVSPDLGAEGKYEIDVTVKSECVSETQRIEVGVLPKLE